MKIWDLNNQNMSRERNGSGWNRRNKIFIVEQYIRMVEFWLFLTGKKIVNHKNTRPKSVVSFLINMYTYHKQTYCWK